MRRFYVNEDMSKNVTVMTPRFDGLQDALRALKAIPEREGVVPALGVGGEPRVGGQTVAVDLVHRVHGDNVLVSGGLNRREDLMEIMEEMIDLSLVTHGYTRELFPRNAAMLAVAPLGNVGGFEGYEKEACASMRLKTAGGGLDSINELFVVGHGWVPYRELLENCEDFCENGVLRVEGVNVNYVQDGQLFGIGGQMDVSVSDFGRLKEEIGREYSLRVFDEDFGAYFVSGSFDEIGDAVRAWYDLPDGVMGYVNRSMENGRECSVFNGMDDDFEEIPLELAARMYGFDASSLLKDNGGLVVDDILAGASARIGASKPGKSCVELSMG